MILVFGGTTEGRKTVEMLEDSGSPYYYSTKTGEQELSLQNGQRIDGALDAEAMKAFIKAHDIRLIVDAAHPFATQLHQTILNVSATLQIPVIRYERIYPPRDPDLEWLEDYSQVPTDIHTLLATTGVQSISKLKYLEAKGVKVFYRILPRESSIALAKKLGAEENQLCFFEEGSTIDVEADAILLKESGLSGGFVEKVEAAKAKGMRILVLKRPELFTIDVSHRARSRSTMLKNDLALFSLNRDLHSSLFTSINGPYGLRRAVEKLLPEFYPLHSGLTTGTCATAAAIAATIRLTKGETPAEVPVILPDGETIQVAVSYGEGYASCFKEAGDDPDVTNGIEVRAAVNHGDCPLCEQRSELHGDCPRDSRQLQVEILGGEGVGTITLPGFDYPPGSPAINKAPREMIANNLKSILSPLTTLHSPLRITISVPNGAEIARRTFNPRLGIEGGISIIGVSGIVKPFSEEAFIDSIRKCVQVALASGTNRIVINSGGKSERFIKALYPTLPRQAFIEYGNYIGETLKFITNLSPLSTLLSPLNVTLGVMLGKAVKLAQGHLDTHSRKATMDKDFILQMLQEAGIDIDISNITLARELWEKMPKEKIQEFVNVVIRHCETFCKPLLPEGALTILLIDDEGTIYFPS